MKRRSAFTQTVFNFISRNQLRSLDPIFAFYSIEKIADQKRIGRKEDKQKQRKKKDLLRLRFSSVREFN